MNEFKYRAWSKNYKKVFNVENIDYEDGWITFRVDEKTTVTTQMINTEIMKDTGFIDVSGKKIYEGDIVVALNLDGEFAKCAVSIDEEGDSWLVVIEMKKRDITTICLLEDKVKGFVSVIGNIYEGIKYE